MCTEVHCKTFKTFPKAVLLSPATVTTRQREGVHAMLPDPTSCALSLARQPLSTCQPQPSTSFAAKRVNPSTLTSPRTTPLGGQFSVVCVFVTSLKTSYREIPTTLAMGLTVAVPACVLRRVTSKDKGPYSSPGIKLLGEGVGGALQLVHELRGAKQDAAAARGAAGYQQDRGQDSEAAKLCLQLLEPGPVSQQRLRTQDRP